MKKSKSEQLVPFLLYRNGEGQTGAIEGEIVVNCNGISIRLAGYGDCSSKKGYGEPIFIEHYEGKLWVRAWADINQEDPTHSIDMEGAREDARVE